jgi:anti-sigma factor RsiW
MSDADPVRDEELHAFVDAQLVVDWLQSHADDTARVAAWQAQRLELRRLHRGLDVGPTPDALTRSVPGRRPWRWPLATAAVLLLGVGLGAGWVAARVMPGGGVAAPAATGRAFAHDAAIAHAVFAPEVRHPVEVAAADEAHLVQWLGRRLGMSLQAPVLQPQGFRLLGGRLLPGPQSPCAQFMYEDAKGRRVSLYLTVFTAGEAPRETAFRAVRSGAVESFYWVEGRFGYALSGELPADELMALAREAYRQLAR